MFTFSETEKLFEKVSRKPSGHGAPPACLSEPVVDVLQRHIATLALGAKTLRETKLFAPPRHSSRQAGGASEAESQAVIFSLGKSTASFSNNFSVSKGRSVYTTLGFLTAMREESISSFAPICSPEFFRCF